MRTIPVPVAAAIALSLTLLAGGALGRTRFLAQESAGPPDPKLAVLAEEFLKQGIRLNFERGICAFPVDIAVRRELLEYLVVGPAGATHEAMFATEIMPSVLNTALLTLGVAPGTNARWRQREPEPTKEELAAGVHPYEVDLPEGDGFLPYIAWRRGDELYFYRLEDLLQNLHTGSSMRRHRWIYLGSRMVQDRDGKDVFVADLERNLINLSFFGEGNTLVTAAVEDCVFQTVWMPNAWLLPPRGSRVWFVLARERLESLPAAWLGDLPQIEKPTAGKQGARSGARGAR